MPLIVIVAVRVIVAILTLVILINTISTIKSQGEYGIIGYSIFYFVIVFACWWAAECRRLKTKREIEERERQLSQAQPKEKSSSRFFLNIVMIIAAICTILAYFRGCLTNI